MNFKKTYTKNESFGGRLPNHWDALAFLVVLATLVLIVWGAMQMVKPFHAGEKLPISLDVINLPHYALRSVLRMLFALLLSLFATFTLGTFAAKNKHAERIIIPLVDILQSVPILGYLSIATVFFIALVPGSLLGPEFAAIFAIFTSQAWNMILSFYQSVRSVPKDLQEVSKVLQLSAWQHFWRVDVPYSMPGLLWNMMLSMSASWFFVVASEAISGDILLPGIGSYIAKAVSEMDMKAVAYSIVAMFVVILVYDQLLFRPLNCWIEKFKWEKNTDEDESSSWVLNLFQRARLFQKAWDFMEVSWDKFVNFPLFLKKTSATDIPKKTNPSIKKKVAFIWYSFLSIIMASSIYILVQFIAGALTLREVLHVFYLGLITGIRVSVLILLSIVVWTPIGVWIGLRPRVTAFAQPIIQFLASFPANLLFPIVVILIVKYKLNVNIWTSPLMVLGTQWYILFNVIAGASALPEELLQTAVNLNVRGWLWWKRLILPGISPYLITGTITAAGGAWNASIVAEYVVWGKTTLHATGLGNYITTYSNLHDFPQIILGISVMSFYVLTINYLVWRPLYNFSIKRFGF